MLPNSLVPSNSLKLKQISKHPAKQGVPEAPTHLVVIARAEEDVISSGMPFNQTDSSSMPKKFFLRSRNVSF